MSDSQDFCRVCRCEATSSDPLFHPCLCTGTIKHIHQECLLRWLVFSGRTSCEVCAHEFQFEPLYANDTPPYLPPSVLIKGIGRRCLSSIATWLHYALVVFAWVIMVPLVACRIYRALFTGSIASVLMLPIDLLSLERVFHDCVQGLTLVVLVMTVFLSYVWLRDQVMHDGGPPWLNALDDNEGAAAYPPEMVAGEDAQAGQVNALPRPAEDPFVDQDDGLANDVQLGVVAMNWERLLGFDGSLVFLEHVLWLMALNTMFIIVFAFCPYHLGQLTIVNLRLTKMVESTRLTSFITTFVGYVLMAGLLFLCHAVLRLTHLRKACRFAGLCYLYVKIALVYVVEFVLLPSFCGVWIDICSLRMVNGTLSHRLQFFHYAPTAFIYIHWTKGMLYIFYLVTLLYVARDVLRPGVLWFVHHFNNLEVRPVQGLIVHPLHVYLQRILVTYCLTGIQVVLTLLVPGLVIRKLAPSFFPYQLNLAYDSPWDYSIEIVLVQIALPFLLDNDARSALKAALTWWARVVSWLLGLRSYLLGDVEFQPGDVIVMANGALVRAAGPVNKPAAADGAQRAGPRVEEREEAENAQAGGQQEEPQPEKYVPYARPSRFELRCAALVFLFAVSWMVLSCVGLFLPVALGRALTNWLVTSRLLHSLFGQQERPPRHDALNLIAGVTILALLLKAASYGRSCVRVAGRALASVASLPAWRCYASRLSLLALSFGRNLLQLWPWPNDQRGVGRAHGLLLAALPEPGSRTVQLTGAAAAAAAATATDSRPRQLHRAFLRLRLAECVAFGRRHAALGLQYARVASKATLLIVLLCVLLPAIVGLLAELTFLTPFRIGVDKSIYVGFYETWFLGLKLVKVLVMLLQVGPQWWLRTLVDDIVTLLMQNDEQLLPVLRLLMPILCAIGVALTGPLLVSEYCSEWLRLDDNVLFRFGYPVQFYFVLVQAIFVWQLRKCGRLYESIRNERYLIGLSLVNFDGRRPLVGTAADTL